MAAGPGTWKTAGGAELALEFLQFDEKHRHFLTDIGQRLFPVLRVARAGRGQNGNQDSNPHPAHDGDTPLTGRTRR
ncbi:MAG TPA: hypothetical protein RMG48_06845, partial [Myxococcales bacterium LLY-WYZ-16_1]|nr:hypothetical protein [Myxococcales bacterium LLY-WYZ-16_1]